jgi:hypothetical protein
MPKSTTIKPTHKAIQHYYQSLQTYTQLHVQHEGALETAFSQLLADTAKLHGWTLIPKQSMKLCFVLFSGSLCLCGSYFESESSLFLSHHRCTRE